VTATVPAGRLTVLVAPSGQGKTTLLSVVAGLTTPQQGEVNLVDPGTGQSSMPRPGVAGWIGQGTVLLPGTLPDNIAVADPAAYPSRSHAREVGWIRILARTTSSVKVDGVSAGQARRVALARTLLRDAPL
jgi:ABC-type transport system involved in cytochrome bd biosynthesis fused ATPase/permease subunit